MKKNRSAPVRICLHKLKTQALSFLASISSQNPELDRVHALLENGRLLIPKGIRFRRPIPATRQNKAASTIML
jgi:hypothetical protein